MIKELIKLANHLDKSGLRKEADYLDNAIKKTATVFGYLPYVDAPYPLEGDLDTLIEWWATDKEWNGSAKLSETDSRSKGYIVGSALYTDWKSGNKGRMWKLWNKWEDELGEDGKKTAAEIFVATYIESEVSTNSAYKLFEFLINSESPK